MKRISSTKLTPAARATLNELVDSYKEQLLINAASAATSSTGQAEEISVRDIIEGAKLSQKGPVGREVKRREQLRQILIASGVIYTVFGFTFFLQQSFDFNLDFEQVAGLFIGIIGLLLTIFSLYWKRDTSSNLKELISLPTGTRLDSTTVMIQKWLDIELTVRNLVSSRFGESMAKRPISALLEMLSDYKIITIREEKILRQLLRKRNQMLHENKEFSTTEVSVSLKEADLILDKLSEYQNLRYKAKRAITK